MSLYAFQAVPPRQGSPGATQETSSSSQAPSAPAPQAAPAGGMLPMLLPFLILVPFFFMTRRRQKQEQEARKSLTVGDKVVTNGLLGELVEMGTEEAKVKIAPGTTVRVLASTVMAHRPVEAKS